MYTFSFTLDGLTCQACKKVTEKRIGSLVGVKTVSVDLSSKKAHVTADTILSLEEVAATLAGTPYEVIAKETL